MVPIQAVPSALGGKAVSSLQKNLDWLNIMSEDKLSSAEAKRSHLQPTKSFDDMESGKRVPILPRAYQSTKRDSGSKAHPFATTAAKTESSNVGNFSVQGVPPVSKKPPKSPKSPKPLVPPPYAVKNDNTSSSSKGIANMISNWEGRSSLKKQSSDKQFKNSAKNGSDSAAVNGSFGSISKVADSFTQLTPSDSLKINWKQKDSLASNDGDYIKNWISAGGTSDYENVAIDKPNPTAANHRPFSSNAAAAGGAHSQPKRPPATQQALDNSSGAYEVISYQPTTAHPIKPNPPNRKPMVVSSSAKTLKLSHSYVNVDIPSDPEPLPPPVPLKKKRPLVKTPVANDQSDDSELDEEEGNEMHYENWSFLNPREGDQNMTITELESYVKSRKLQGLKAEYFKIRNKPDLSEMKICK